MKGGGGGVVTKEKDSPKLDFIFIPRGLATSLKHAVSNM